MRRFYTILLCIVFGSTLAVKTVHAEVSDGKKVSIEYTLTLADKSVADSNVGGEPLTFIHGKQEILPKLQAELLGMNVGDVKDITIQAADGYGEVIEQALIETKIDTLPENARKVGADIQTKGPGGQVFSGKVISVTDDTARLDFNHPLAGKTLFFNVKILDIAD